MSHSFRRDLVAATLLIGTIVGFCIQFSSVSALTPPPPSDDYGTGEEYKASCPNLTRTMQRGARDIGTGGQVSELQIFLADHFGLNEEDVVTGYFGKITQQTVIKFQKEEGLPAFGIVGSLTRAKIARVCGTPPEKRAINFSAQNTSGVAPLRVMFSVSGTFNSADLVIDFGDGTSCSGSGCSWMVPPGDNGTHYTTHDYTQNGMYTAHLLNYNNATVSITVGAPQQTGGTLTVSNDASSPGPQIINGGATTVTVGAFRIAASGENVNLTSIQLFADDYNFSVSDITQATLWDGWTKIGTAIFLPGSQIPLGYVATAALTPGVTIPKDSSKIITVRVDVANIGSNQAGTAGHKIQLGIAAVTGVGQTSGMSVVKDMKTGGAPNSSPLYIYKSYPTVSLDTYTLPSSGAADGKLIRFRVNANAAGMVSLAGMAFNVQGLASVANGQVDLCAYTDAGYSSPVSPYPSGCIQGLAISYASSGGYMWFSSPVHIPAGATYYFELRDSGKGTGLVTSLQSGTITTTLLGASGYGGGIVSATSLQGKDAVFVWSGNTKTTSQFSDSDWTVGYLVPGLPANGLSQTRTGSTGGTCPTGTTGTYPNCTSTATADIKVGTSDGPIGVVRGSSYIITYKTSGVSSCGVGWQSADSSTGTTGSMDLAPNIEFSGSATLIGTYTLICTKIGGGSISDTFTVNALPGPGPAGIFATPSSLPPGGGVVKITWNCAALGGSEARLYSQDGAVADASIAGRSWNDGLTHIAAGYPNGADFGSAETRTVTMRCFTPTALIIKSVTIPVFILPPTIEASAGTSNISNLVMTGSGTVAGVSTSNADIRTQLLDALEDLESLLRAMLVERGQ